MIFISLIQKASSIRNMLSACSLPMPICPTMAKTPILLLIPLLYSIQMHIEEGINHFSLHSFISRRFNTMLYKREVPAREITFHIGERARISLSDLHTSSQLALCIHLFVQKAHLHPIIHIKINFNNK